MGNRRKEITARWRKLKIPGRLYWKKNNPRMRRFDSDDVAIRRIGNATVHYKSIEALERFLAETEAAREYHLRGFIRPVAAMQGKGILARKVAEALNRPDICAFCQQPNRYNGNEQICGCGVYDLESDRWIEEFDQGAE